MSVSFTTRSQRRGEVNNIDYSFVSAERFMEMVNKNDFIEWAEVYWNYYGTSASRIEDMISSGLDVLLDIDIQGAKKIKLKIKNQKSKTKMDATFIFVLPPSPEIAMERLKKRNTDVEDVIQRRFKKFKEEIKEYIHYDYIIVNDSLEKAIIELESIITSVRLKTEHIETQWIEKTYL